MSSDRWFAVRCIFQDVDHDDGEHFYEERVTLWRATSLAAAIEKAEVEAAEYVEDLGLRYTGLAQAYGPLSDDLGEGAEVFSLFRASHLPADDYLTRYLDTGTKRQQPCKPA